MDRINRAPAPDVSTVLRDVSSARGLPNAHYTDADVFKRERDAVLFRNWSGIGFAKDVPKPGFVKPVTFLGMPLLIVRDRDGSLRVFQNTCRHRGMILVDAPGHLRGVIRCPYHSWCYGLDGRLKVTPHVGGPGINTHAALDISTLGLIQIRSHVWMGVVFVNVDGQAPAFEQAHAPLLERWSEFDKPLHAGGAAASFTLDVATNWKLAVENYCESYHLPWVHPGLNSYSRLEDHYNIIERGAYSGQGTYVYRQIKGDRGEMLTDFAGLSEKWETGAEYIAVYPNVLLGVQRDQTFAIVLDPVDCERTIERIALFYAAPVTADLEALADRNAAQWKQVFKEDVFVVEGMQRGRHGVHFDGGRFSPAMDGPTHNFHHWVAAQVQSHAGAAV
ncbi:MAG: aromatic ring-hydroxylating dioxygenase subunit alpha [Pseudomonadota bacterium]